MGKHSNNKVMHRYTRKNSKYINKTTKIKAKKSRKKYFNDHEKSKQGGNSTIEHKLNKIQIKKLHELKNYYPIFNTQLQDDTVFNELEEQNDKQYTTYNAHFTHLLLKIKLKNKIKRKQLIGVVGYNDVYNDEHNDEYNDGDYVNDGNHVNDANDANDANDVNDVNYVNNVNDPNYIDSKNSIFSMLRALQTYTFEFKNEDVILNIPPSKYMNYYKKFKHINYYKSYNKLMKQIYHVPKEKMTITEHMSKLYDECYKLAEIWKKDLENNKNNKNNKELNLIKCLDIDETTCKAKQQINETEIKPNEPDSPKQPVNETCSFKEKIKEIKLNMGKTDPDKATCDDVALEAVYRDIINFFMILSSNVKYDYDETNVFQMLNKQINNIIHDLDDSSSEDEKGEGEATSIAGIRELLTKTKNLIKNMLQGVVDNLIINQIILYITSLFNSYFSSNVNEGEKEEGEAIAGGSELLKKIQTLIKKTLRPFVDNSTIGEIKEHIYDLFKHYAGSNEDENEEGAMAGISDDELFKETEKKIDDILKDFVNKFVNKSPSYNNLFADYVNANGTVNEGESQQQHKKRAFEQLMIDIYNNSKKDDTNHTNIKNSLDLAIDNTKNITSRQDKIDELRTNNKQKLFYDLFMLVETINKSNKNISQQLEILKTIIDIGDPDYKFVYELSDLLFNKKDYKYILNNNTTISFKYNENIYNGTIIKLKNRDGELYEVANVHDNTLFDVKRSSIIEYSNENSHDEFDDPHGSTNNREHFLHDDEVDELHGFTNNREHFSDEDDDTYAYANDSEHFSHEHKHLQAQKTWGAKINYEKGQKVIYFNDVSKWVNATIIDIKRGRRSGECTYRIKTHDGLIHDVDCIRLFSLGEKSETLPGPPVPVPKPTPSSPAPFKSASSSPSVFKPVSSRMPTHPSSPKQASSPAFKSTHPLSQSPPSSPPSSHKQETVGKSVPPLSQPSSPKQETAGKSERTTEQIENFKKDIEGGGCGLENIGNTCFMNTALQMLKYVDENIYYNLNQGHEGTMSDICLKIHQILINEKLSNGNVIKLRNNLNPYLDMSNYKKENDHKQYDAHDVMSIYIDCLASETVNDVKFQYKIVPEGEWYEYTKGEFMKAHHSMLDDIDKKYEDNKRAIKGERQLYDGDTYVSPDANLSHIFIANMDDNLSSVFNNPVPLNKRTWTLMDGKLMIRDIKGTFIDNSLHNIGMLDKLESFQQLKTKLIRFDDNFPDIHGDDNKKEKFFKDVDVQSCAIKSGLADSGHYWALVDAHRINPQLFTKYGEATVKFNDDKVSFTQQPIIEVILSETTNNDVNVRSMFISKKEPDVQQFATTPTDVHDKKKSNDNEPKNDDDKQKSPESQKSSLALPTEPTIILKNYGVLGESINGGETNTDLETDYENICIVDPAGLNYIHGDPERARGASGAIYELIGLNKKPKFPDDVKNSIHNETKAKYYKYSNNSKDYHVIHVVGPDFRESLTRNVPGRAIDEQQLSEAYKNVFVEFCKSSCETLRLLPISGGIFSGLYKNQIKNEWTKVAINNAYSQLTEEKKKVLNKREIHMCIFDDSEFEAYEKQFNTQVFGKGLNEVLVEPSDDIGNNSNNGNNGNNGN
jgi:hypothetical protein